MKFSYKFSNLLGTVYRGGDLLFSTDGNTVISPVGNRISMFDLKNHKSETLPVESRYSYTALDLSSNGVSLLAVNEDGEIHLISLISRSVLHKLRTNRTVNCVKFSPDSKQFAITKEDCVFVYSAPGPHSRDYTPPAMRRVLKGAFDDTVQVAWSSCSRLLAVAARDGTVRIYPLHNFANLAVCSLGGMTDPAVATFFEPSSLDCYSLSRGGQIAVWESSIDLADLVLVEPTVSKKKSQKKVDEEEEEEDGEVGSEAVETVTAEENTATRAVYSRTAKHFLRDHLEGEGGGRAELSCADYQPSSKILAAAFNTGAFLLLSLPDCSLVHSLAISDQQIGAVRFNCTGDWLAVGCPGPGQLLVWEWQSETYVLKQQGHASEMTCLAHSPDGATIATGGTDSKIKLWNCGTGFCFVTFSEHEAGVTGLVFAPSGKVVLSCSLDGTVRAFDMTRYRNFKTLATPRPAQLSCISVDSGGDLVAAGGQDVFEVFLWSLSTGRLVDVLGGHEGPVAGLAFSPAPASSQLATVSWDGTLRILDAVTASATTETVQLGSDGLAVAWRPDGAQLTAATLAGQLQTYDVRTGSQVGSIHGRRDLRPGKADEDKISAKKKREAAHFTALCYSADGAALLAAGHSKHICIYHVSESLLLRRLEVTQNRSFQGMDETLSRRRMAGLLPDRQDGTELALPGTRTQDLSSRAVRPELRVTDIQFAPTGRAFSLVSTEGLLTYSLDRHLVFDPLDLSAAITPATVRAALDRGGHAPALGMAVRLGEKDTLREAVERAPLDQLELLAPQLSLAHLHTLLQFMAEELQSTPHLQFYLRWIRALLFSHGSFLKQNSLQFLPLLNLFIKNISIKSEDLSKVCDNNKYTMRYLIKLSQTKIKINKSVGDTNAVEKMDEGLVGNIDEVSEVADSDEEMFEELVAKWSDGED